MTFKKRFKGYDPAEVDKYIEETAARDKATRVAQKERIDELTEENYSLREQLKKLQANEEAISATLIASQNLAQQLKHDADKYADVVLIRAKIFYATWRAYSQTLISSLSAEEVAEFNKLQRKIEEIINAYDGKDISKEVEERVYAALGTYQNPITKVEQAAEHAIELSELAKPDLSLDDLCAELGLISKKA